MLRSTERRATSRASSRQGPPRDEPVIDAPRVRPPSSKPARPPAEAPAVDWSDDVAFHVVSKGDTLSDLARRYLGSAGRWQELVEVNDHINPHRLRIGDEIAIPSRSGGGSARASVQPKRIAHHEVVSGDTLSGIATRYYGDARKWKQLYEHNRARIPRPESLVVGTVLDLP